MIKKDWINESDNIIVLYATVSSKEMQITSCNLRINKNLDVLGFFQVGVRKFLPTKYNSFNI